jgi:hypothetical protein
VGLAACVALWVLSGCDRTGLIGRDEITVAPEPDAAEEAAEPDAALDELDAEVATPEAAREAAAPEAGPSDAGLEAAVRLGPWAVLPWKSGVHYGNEPPSYDAFAKFRGRPLDIVTLYPERDAWAGITNPSWWFDNFEDYPARLVLSQALYPNEPPALGNNQDCAAGMYDAEWKKLGSFLALRGPDTIVRLGWGPNDPTHEWRSDADPAAFIACFRRIVAAIRSTAPSVLIDFSFDPVPSTVPASGNPYDLYPGDDVVDIIGMDLFDHLPATRTQAEWDAKCRSNLGLCTLIDFARRHNKRFSVGEWGVATCGQDPGGDNAFFVEKMVETFYLNADILAYEAYFDDPAVGVVCSSLMADAGAPEARAAYKRLYQRP